MATENSRAVIIVESCQTTDSSGEHTDDNNVDKIDDMKNVSYWNSLYIFGILMACFLNAAILFLIPRNNSILYPEFWYETLFYYVIAVSSRLSAAHILELFTFTRVQDLVTRSHYLKVFSTCSLSFAIPYCMSYVIWTMWLENNHPLPHLGSFGLLGGMSINIVFFWFFFSHELRQQEKLKRQAKAFLIFQGWAFLDTFARGMLSSIATSSLQWMLIILIPFTRKSSIWIAEEIIKRYRETNNRDVRFLVICQLMINYTTYLASQISTLDQITVYGILTVELLLHVFTCYQIVKMNTRIGEENQSSSNSKALYDRKLKAQDLAMSEIIEAIVPIAFAIVFTMTFFGPNAILMKDVGNNYFGGKAINNVNIFYFGLIQMFAIDFVAIIVSGISLQYLCNLDLFQELCNIMNQYWMIFIVKLPSITNYYFLKDVNLGMDDTFDFLWITNDGRNDLICNAVELMDYEKQMLLSNCTCE